MGEIIGGRYEIGPELGQGGMGTVFYGTDVQTGEAVAIKLLRPEVAAQNPTLVERFLREGEALRRLNHPNIVKMLETVTEGSQRYLVIEYISGGSLQELLREKEHLPIERVLQIGLELTDALTRAHYLRIIHRDLKPANVLLAEDGTSRLTDFGIAHLSDQSPMTESGVVVGTFSYLSPEACEGRALDARADIWSLGLILYELVSGVRPFERDQVAATITAILTLPVPDLRELRPDVPIELAALIDRMLEKNRDQRIASARQVGAELEAISQGEVTPSMSASKQVMSRFLESAMGTEITPLSPIPGSPTVTGLVAPKAAVPANSRSGVRSRLVAIAVGIIILLAAGTGIILGSRSANQEVLPTPIPIGADEYGVLIADLQPVKTETRDVSRLIINNLRQEFEEEAPFSKIRVMPYPKIITTNAEAQAAAQSNNASVVVWGNYTADEIQLSIQIGVLSAFDHNGFDRTLLERSANVRVQMTDETQQSIAPDILSVAGVLQFADGSILGFGRTLAALDALNVQSATIVGDSVAAHIHRYLTLYLTDPNSALEEANAVLKMDANNPLAYAFRSQGRWRLLAENGAASGVAEVDNADRDALTAQRLGPTNWVVPYTLFRSSSYTYWYSYEQELANLNLMVNLRPDDWYLHLSRAITYYQTKQFDQAETDMNQAVTLKPDSAFPYGFAALLALRKGHIADAANAVNTMLNDMPPDPEFLSRLENALYGNYHGLGGSTFPVFSQVILGQFDDALQSIQDSARSGSLPQQSLLVDLSMLQAVTYCNLGRLNEAARIYNLIIPTNSDYPLLYLLRADTRFQQGSNEQAKQDLQKVQSSTQAEVLAPFIKAVAERTFSCKELFDFDKVHKIADAAEMTPTG